MDGRTLLAYALILIIALPAAFWWFWATRARRAARRAWRRHEKSVVEEARAMARR